MNSTVQPWKTLSASLQIGILTEGWTLASPPTDTTEDVRAFRYVVHFAAPFDAPPVVHLGLTGFDLDQRDSNRLGLRAIEITREGFVAEVSTWRDTRVYSVEFSWLALGA
jgi:hypothetical protein